MRRVELNDETRAGAFGRLILAFCGALALAACGGREAPEGALSGTVALDGSSTVFPISEAVAEEFQQAHPHVRVTVGESGTGGGFKKFCVGETDISDASRPIKPTEAELSAKNGIGYVEIPVAFDGIAVVVNPANDFVTTLTAAELKRIWEPQSAVRTWKDVRSEWPDREIRLYGPGTDSGTFDYFTEAIMGKSRASRPDYTASEDDNVLVQGVAGDADGLGYFGFAYYATNKQRLKIVPVDGGDGPITPTHETINDGTYQPLSRPIFIYVSSKALERPEVDAFVKYYVAHAATLSEQVGYVALPARVYELAGQRYENRKLGSLFQKGRWKAGTSIVELLESDL